MGHFTSFYEMMLGDTKIDEEGGETADQSPPIVDPPGDGSDTDCGDSAEERNLGLTRQADEARNQEVFFTSPSLRTMFVHSKDNLGIWHRLPVILGLIHLAARRHLHQEYNLLNVGQSPSGVRFNPGNYPYRTSDGRFNDPFNEGAGTCFLLIINIRFGFQCLPHIKLHAFNGYLYVQLHLKHFKRKYLKLVQLMRPDPMIELIAPKAVAAKCPPASFKFYKTKVFPTGFCEIKNGAKNIRTPWWDGSVIYGANVERLRKLRTFKDGKLKISEDGLLLHDQDGIALSGDVRNSWAGVSTLQALFIKEHNAVCDAIKIQTIDWTVELLKTDILLAGMRTNWYGLLGKKFKDKFGHVGGAILGGVVGLKKPDNHGVPYSLTEEFVSVYRMHSLLPDYLYLRDTKAAPGPNKSPPLAGKIPMANLIG
ncbi:hypothetical protein QUC31_018236 [Theobroma cacao]